MKILLKNVNSIDRIPINQPVWMENKRWDKIQELKAEADKKRSLVSGYLLDSMCRDLEIDNPVYGYTENGKPFLNGVDCTFNISHSGDYAALVYHADSGTVGVDVQKIRPMREGMERRLLHEKEKSFVPAEETKRMYYLNRIWAVKESFVKMTGEGLSRDFRTMCVDFENGIIVAEEGLTAYFNIWEWKEEYYLAVCTTKREACDIIEI